jgi:predicted Zn-dependent protease
MAKFPDLTDVVELHDAAVIELRERRPNLRRVRDWIARMCALSPDQERTWREAAKLWATMGEWDNAIACAQRCQALGNPTAAAYIDQLRVQQEMVRHS